MSNLIISQSGSGAEEPNSSVARRALFWKELRLIGIYATALVASCLGVILFFEAIEWFGPFLDTFQQLQVGIAQVTPILVTLSTAAAIFSIEHEYQSFSFLRLMPFSSRRIVATKILAAASFSFLSAVVLWPISLWLAANDFKDSTLHDGLFSIAATTNLYLFGIYFSMTSKKVIAAIGKSALGFAITSVPSSLALWFDVSTTGDTLFWSLEYGFKSASIVILIGLIALKSRTWTHDTVPSNWVPNWLILPKREIQSNSSRPLISPLWRLVWLQRRTGLWVFIIAFLPFCFFLKELAADLIADRPYNSSTLFSRSALCLAFSVGILGAGIFNGVQSARMMLVQPNYRPSLIWLSQLIVPVFICLATGLVIDSYASEFSRRIFYFTESMLIGLAVGQMFSIFFRSYIVAIALTFLTLWNAFLLHDYLTDYVNQFWPNWVCLIGLPFVTTFTLRRKWLYSQPMRNVLVPFLWLAAAISVVQFPINRLVEIPWVSDHERAITFPHGKGVSWEMLHDLQKVIDDRELTEYSYDLIERVLDEYEGGEILLTHTRPHEKDLRRYSRVDAILNGALIPKGGMSDRVYTLKMKILETWPRSLRFSDPSFDGAIRLAQDRRTTTDDLRQLIEAFKYEEHLERYRYWVAAKYFSVERSARYPRPDRAPRQRRSSFDEFFFWERSRESRARNFAAIHAIHAIQYIDELRKSFERSEKQMESLERTRSSLPPLYRSIVEEYPDFDFAESVPFFHGDIREQRILRIGLAIVAWQKDHNGEYPDSLQQLVGVYLDHIPDNPMNETPFCYAPNGLPGQYIKPNGPTQNLINNGRNKGGRYLEELVADQPFLWINGTYWDSKPDDKQPVRITSVDGLKEGAPNCDPRLIQFYVIPRIKNLEQE